MYRCDIEKVIEYTDYEYSKTDEDGVFLPPVIMEGYEEVEHKLTWSQKWNRLTVNTSAIVVGLTCGIVYAVIGYFTYKSWYSNKKRYRIF